MFYDSYLKSEFNFSNKALRALWLLIYILLFRYTLVPFNSWRVFLLRLFGAQIGCNVLVYPSVKIWAPWNLFVGSGSVIGPNVILYNIDKIIIGEDVTLSQNAHICTASHNINSKHRELQHAPC